MDITFLEQTNIQFETVDYTRWILHDEEGNCLLYQCDAENGTYRTFTTVRLEPGTYYVRLWGPDDNTQPSSYEARRYYSLSWGRSSSDRPTGGCPEIEDIADPLYGCQTNLRNSFRYPGEDINVEPVWDKGNFGAGVNVVVVDQGVDYNHEDLSHAIDITRSGYLEGSAGIFDPDKSHGTLVAGVIAAQHNSIGVRGIAPQAKIYSFNSGSELVDSTFRKEIPLKHEHIRAAVSNNSWGIGGGGPYVVMSRAVKESIITGITEGFYGKGTSYVFASPNTPTGTIAYNSNFFEFETFYAVITVCGVPEFGHLRGSVDGIPYWYKNILGYGTNMWICAPSKVHTTDVDNGYVSARGTSYAAASVSGVIALMRSANPDLTWRDVKLILAASARHIEKDHPEWETGALQYGSESARYTYNPSYAFGVVDADAAVTMAESWNNLPEMTSATVASGAINITIPDRTAGGRAPGYRKKPSSSPTMAPQPRNSSNTSRSARSSNTGPSGTWASS